jgi:lysophospholipase L1-like esterase
MRNGRKVNSKRQTVLTKELSSAATACNGFAMFRPSIHPNALLARMALVVFSLAQSPLTVLAQTDSGAQKWEAEIQAFEASDKTNPPPKGAILFVGSSSIRLWQSLAHDFRKHKVVNRGFGGSHLADSVSFVDRIVIPYRPKMILLYAGDNDIAAGKAPEQVLADFKSFVEKVQTALPKTRIAYISIKPSLARWQLVEKMKGANQLIKDYAQKKKNLMFIDVFTPMLGLDGEPRKELFVSDGLHLNAAGYELWASTIRPYLNSKHL